METNAIGLSEISKRDTVPRTPMAWPAESPRVGLVMTSGDQAPRVLDFGSLLALTIGRAEPADVCVSDPGVSRLHVRFTREQGGVRVVDLGSRNGTWVRGLRVTEALLVVGDCVVVGNTTLLVQPAQSSGVALAFQNASPVANMVLADSMRDLGPGVNLRASLREHEAKLIREALRFSQGNQRRAAAMLELPLRTFERKLRNMNMRQKEIARTAM